MITLKGENIYLRALEPEDLEFIHTIENDESLWELSNTITPYSKFLIKQYLEHSHKDIFEVRQLRLVISSYLDEPLGMIDLFDFDFKNSRAGVGILVKESKNRQLGLGREALSLLINYSFTHLGLHQLYCNISENNEASIKLFTSQGFEKIGLKKDWNYMKGNFTNEYLFQLLNK
ncbi:MAG: GNAT family N-acetyltransferase [Flavobacteriales bacterium]|nr:GNAT family N-acetyltransferase [Flavobacteriia bacterium]NCP07024.1 GNAT family N-acetyltransferase [Flavobacteriales bacterium]PIV93541.1 MAG: GNAT family N-acetyltransferase [Flavobacteriaceae bacterium CG17_big_fil_post_rev_8_21_14_2_50_33_15]PIY09694.1 MAG: GNAT family N-acetyltransferase [Flavobacteriaceae bacterium CG_4_10_14_3_um_filter_33_47]PJB16580.1 MAG: GNAT family N-acetyltransferase [Flavobacteriaceae bacterium CG_4_9_14_3_um_filter_33_16]